jgi:hypothetical protein
LTCLFGFRDSYGLLDHLSSDGFDYGNDGLFDPPRSFLHWRAFGLGLGNRSLCSFDYLACLTAFSGVCSSQFGSALYFDPFLRLAMIHPRFGWCAATRIDARSSSPGN